MPSAIRTMSFALWPGNFISFALLRIVFVARASNAVAEHNSAFHCHARLTIAVPRAHPPQGLDHSPKSDVEPGIVATVANSVSMFAKSRSLWKPCKVLALAKKSKAILSSLSAKYQC